MLKKESFWNLIGCILGVVVFLVGVVICVTPPDSYSTSSTDYATFGADFYTYQYEATRAVASNAAVTANNLREMGHAQAHYAGVLFMVIGLLTTISYGKKYFTDLPNEAQPETNERCNDMSATTAEEDHTEALN